MARARLQQTQRYTNMLPRSYVATTLARLLPTAQQLKQLNHDQLVKLWQYKAQLRLSIEENPAKFLQPNKPGQELYLLCDNPDYIGQFFFAGNKSGKTTGTCIKLAERLTGQAIWGLDSPHSRASLTWPVPQRWVFFTEDFQSHEETIVPTYLTWCPRQYHPVVIRAQNGLPSHIIHSNGSILYLRTYEQGFAKAEGKDWDGAAYDEPPPRELYISSFRGLVARGGKIFIGATLLKEAWLYDELQNDFNIGFNGTIYDNPWLDQKTLAAFETTMDEDERAVRIHGKPINLVGLIYPEMQDEPPFVISLSQFESRLPWNPVRELPYPVIMAVDPHERKPLHCEWGWVLPDDGILWFDWKLVQPGSFTQIFEFLAAIESEHAQLGQGKTQLVIMDPNRGPAIQAGETSWQDQFEAHEFPVMLGNDDLSVGHTAVRSALREGQMRWTEACRGVGGPVHAMLRYSWDDWQKRLRDKKSLKEMPKENYKDWPDCHRYAVMAQLQFDALQHAGDSINLRELSGRRLRAYI